MSLEPVIKWITDIRVIIGFAIFAVTGLATSAGYLIDKADNHWVTYAALEEYQIKQEIRDLQRENKKIKLKIELKDATDMDRATLKMNESEIEILKDELKAVGK